jgi:iron complex outermembrane receptor protein
MLRTEAQGVFALCVCLFSLSAAVAQEANDDDPVTAPTVVVTATRSEESIATIPGAVTVVTEEQIEEQIQSGQTLGDALGKLVPGLTPGSESISNFGQTLRGRGIAVLIDGIPQSTTRNVSRSLATIDPSAVERIEVIRGATAIYGDGATGGIINIITKRPTEGPLTLSTEIGSSISLTHPSDSLSKYLRQGLSGRQGALDYVLSLGLERTGGMFDAEGDRIPPDPHGQGGIADTDTWNVLAKFGVDLAARQRLQLTLNRYDSEQDTDYASDPSVKALPPRTQKARAIAGLELDEKQGSENTLVSLDYHHEELANNKLHGQVFYRDYFTRFFPFDGRAFAIFGNTIFQSRLESQKRGGRLEIETPWEALSDARVLWGVDYTDEISEQPVSIMDPAAFDSSGGLVFRKTGDRGWVPPVNLKSLGLFAQLEVPAGERWTLRGGMRHERIEMRIDDFTTLAGASVTGGTLKFDDTLFNLGAVYQATVPVSLYTNLSQGFSVPDFGLTLRGAPDGASVDTLQLEAQRVDAVEVGVRGDWYHVQTTLAAFYNESDLGTSSGGFNQPVVRAPERVWGAEATLDWRLLPKWTTGGTLTWSEGESDPDRDGRYTYLNSWRIAPLKLTAYVEHQTTEKWRNRVQALYNGERSRFGASTAFGERPVESYYTVDWISRVDIGRGTLRLAIENLLNKQYFTRDSQLLRTGANDSYAAGEGAVLSAAYSIQW